MYPVYNLNTPGGQRAVYQHLNGHNALGGGMVPNAFGAPLKIGDIRSDETLMQILNGDCPADGANEIVQLHTFGLYDFFFSIVIFDGSIALSLSTISQNGYYAKSPSPNKLDLYIKLVQGSEMADIFNNWSFRTMPFLVIRFEAVDGGLKVLGFGLATDDDGYPVDWDLSYLILNGTPTCWQGMHVAHGELDISDYLDSGPEIEPFGVIVGSYFIICNYIGVIDSISNFIRLSGDNESYVDFDPENVSSCETGMGYADFDGGVTSISEAKAQYPDYDWDNPITEPYPEPSGEVGLSATKKHFIRIS